MRASLDSQLAALGRLFFTASQAQDIRTKLAATEAALANQLTLSTE